MRTAPAAETPESWGAAGRGYAEKVAPFLMQASTGTFVDRPGVDAGTEALEVGAGSGALAEAPFPRVESLLANEFAPGMMCVLRERMGGSASRMSTSR